MARVRRRWTVGAAMGAAVLLLAGCSGSTVVGSEEKVPSITARGIGRVTGVPDTIVLTMGVETRAQEASAALQRNNERTSAVMEQIRQAGVEQEDIQTSQFSINPQFDDEGRVIDGYVVTNLVTARMSTEDDAGALIDAAAEAAGNDVRVQSVRFEIDDKGDLFARARADAVERAREQAEQLAEAAGVDLGDVRSITESSTVNPPIPFMARTGPESLDAGVPLSPGSEEITLEVEVIYEID